METNNTPATQEPRKELVLPITTAELTPVQKGWLALSEMKTNTFTQLQKSELAIQVILNGYETMELASLQTAIAAAKTGVSMFKSERLHFTNMLNERIVKPSMEFEKRSEELIGKAEVVELTKRQEANKTATATANKLAEANKLRAHIKNEYARIATQYKNDLSLALANGYAEALKQKLPFTSTLVHALQAGISTKLSEIKLSAFVKFPRVLVTDEEAILIFKEIPQYNKAEDYNAAIDTLRNDTFKTYKEDLSNAEQVAEQVVSQVQEHIQAENQNLELETSTNNLVGAAESFVLTAPGAAKTTVKTKTVVIPEESPAYAMKILTLFIKNWGTAVDNLGTKSFIKLVDPFAKALDKAGIKDEQQLTYKEVAK